MADELNSIKTNNPVDDSVVQKQDPLTLNVDDETLYRVLNARIEASRSWYRSEKNLYERQKQNVNFRFGRNVLPKKLKKYESDFMDNVIWEAESSIKPIALSRMPDMIVKPGNKSEDAKKTAEQVSKIIDTDVKKRENRRALGMAFNHLPAYFTGVIKVRWDVFKGTFGDYLYECIHPDNIVFDHTCTSNNPDDMDFISEALQISIKDCLAKFPKKEEELLKVLGIEEDKKGDEKELATKIKIWETHFKWLEKKPDGTYRPIECVMWKYKTVVLDKMLTPNYDWEGENVEKLGGQKLNEGAMRTIMMGQMQGLPTPEIESERVYYNYFRYPRKPYIILGYDQWGEMPYDETSRIEQVIYLQKDVNKRGKQITEMADRTRGKHVFSALTGVKPEDIQELDLSDPEQDLIIPGDVSKLYTFIQGPIPSEALFKDKELNKTAIFNKMGVHDTTRGEVTSDVATTNQIAREADYGRIDDLTEETINAAAEEMAKWALQFIKLRYTEDHFTQLLGNDGAWTYQRINRDMIDDGMEVTISASGVDKLMRKRQASEMATLKLIDPLNYYKDMEVSNPEQRTEMLMTFTLNPAEYMAKYVQGLGSTDAMAMALGNQPAPGMGAVPPQPGAVPPEGAPPVATPEAMPIDTGAVQPTEGAIQ